MKGNFLCVFSQADKSSMLPYKRVPGSDALIGNRAHHLQLLQTDFQHSFPHLPAQKPDSLPSDRLTGPWVSSGGLLSGAAAVISIWQFWRVIFISTIMGRWGEIISCFLCSSANDLPSFDISFPLYIYSDFFALISFMLKCRVHVTCQGIHVR